MRIFVASASDHLTDHLPLSEGLIALSLIEGLTARGHEVVACVDRASLRSRPASTVVELGRTCPFESLTPSTRPRAIDRVLAAHGRGTFDVVHWLFPQDPQEIRLPHSSGARTVIGPLMGRWPVAGLPRRRRAGDYIRRALGPSCDGDTTASSARLDMLLVAHPEVISGLPPAREGKSDAARVRHRREPFRTDAATNRPDVPFCGEADRGEGRASPACGVCRLSKTHADARLSIVGDGPLMPWVRDYCREHGLLLDSVDILGVVPYEAMPEMLSRCSVFACPRWASLTGWRSWRRCPRAVP